jgi:SulP family sulfate permease
MTALQSKGVKTISTTDDDVTLPSEEQELLDRALGRLLLFQLTGPMIFGVAKTINREHNAIEECEAVVFDLSEVSHLGVTASLALENAIKEAIEVGRSVYLVVLPGATRKRLEKLKLLDLLPDSHVSEKRFEVLLHAVNQLPQLQEVSA